MAAASDYSWCLIALVSSIICELCSSHTRFRHTNRHIHQQANPTRLAGSLLPGAPIFEHRNFHSRLHFMMLKGFR
jgi:hypothetical protein